MSKIIKEYAISATPEAVWEALTDAKVIEEWSGSPAVMTEKKGTAFSLWDGYCVGKNLEVERYRRLVQDWQEPEWPEPSRVVFELQPQDGGTHIHFEQSGVPENRMKDIDEGWDSEYLGKMKEYLEAR
jgi:uncharacterized protein YndB with AHSA1/START domain